MLLNTYIKGWVERHMWLYVGGKGIEEELKEEVRKWKKRGALQEQCEECIMNWGEELFQSYVVEV